MYKWIWRSLKWQWSLSCWLFQFCSSLWGKPWICPAWQSPALKTLLPKLWKSAYLNDADNANGALHTTKHVEILPLLETIHHFFPCQLDKHKLDFFNYIIDFSSCLAIEIRRKQWMFSSSLTLKKKCLKISLWDGHLVLQDASPSRPVLLTVNSVFAWD